MGTQLPSHKRRHSPPIFGPCLLWLNGWMDHDATWYEGRPRPRPDCVTWGSSDPPPKKAHSPQLSASLLWPNSRHLIYCWALVIFVMHRWEVNLTNWTGLNTDILLRSAEDRRSWRKIVPDAVNPQTEDGWRQDRRCTCGLFTKSVGLHTRILSSININTLVSL